MADLAWEELLDDDDNPYYEAASAYHDDGDSFMWRVSPVLRGGKIVWTLENSTHELVGDTNSDDEEWDTAEEGKAYCQKVNDEILKEFREE